MAPIDPTPLPKSHATVDGKRMAYHEAGPPGGAAEYTGFLLVPDGFFDRNPAIDVPPSPDHCH